MAVLDEFSGFEFEDLMEDVFRNLGYENVHQSTKTGDEGRDILMEEVVDGVRRGVVVECKHTSSVGRPVVQKLHSAVTTYDFDGPVRGIVVTTGTFTNPAREYAEKVRANGGGTTIELIDGTDLRRIADEVGLDIYNGHIEILCTDTLRPFDPTAGADAPVRDAFRDVDNLDIGRVPSPSGQIELQPVLSITASIDAVFETSVGVVHEIHESARFVVDANRGHPEITKDEVRQLVDGNWTNTIEVDEASLGETYETVSTAHFGQTETAYKDWAIDQLRTRYTTTVHYTGGNNVDYEKDCEPKRSDVTVQSIEPVYLPKIRQTTTLGEYDYPYEYYAAGPSRLTLEDGVRRCVHCDSSGGSYTFCTNCGSVNCGSHTKTERVEETPICTGCAVTERFALRTKYFYDEANRDEFRAEYEEMAVHEKAMENKPLVAGSFVGAVVTVLFVLTSMGLV
ncbi:restriction endonuclease [Haloarchaeobius sp. DFWS5]|uniref:restriction endonuclease n=1 Tax=Haloarchaeobius sp. DFWS5 TaxID=3446114 RepID=UPI003EB8B6A3